MNNLTAHRVTGNTWGTLLTISRKKGQYNIYLSPRPFELRMEGVEDQCFVLFIVFSFFRGSIWHEHEKKRTLNRVGKREGGVEFSK